MYFCDAREVCLENFIKYFLCLSLFSEKEEEQPMSLKNLLLRIPIKETCYYISCYLLRQHSCHHVTLSWMKVEFMK